MTQARERALNRARKVFRHGASTTAHGEKIKCVGVLVELCEKHQLLLHDLDPQFPRRWDPDLLRVRIGLVESKPSGAGTPSEPPRSPHGSASRTTAGFGPRGQRQASADPAGQHRDPGGDFRAALYRTMGAAERARWLQGPAFSQGIRNGLQSTGADERLLAEIRSLNTSNMGMQLSEAELVRWFNVTLSRPGAAVTCTPRSRTIYDDLAADCRARYLTETEQRRRAAQRRKAEDERQRAEATRAERERQAAEQRRKAAEKRRMREPQPTRQAGAGRAAQPQDGAVTFTRSFEHPAEAQLYLKVAGRHIGPEANVRLLTREARCYVELLCSPATWTALEHAYLQVLHDLQMAAATIRAEAARQRDETIRQARVTYEEQCEEAFEVAVRSYTA